MSESSQYPRRRFIGTTVKLAVLGTVLGPLEACNNKKSGNRGTGSTDTTKGKKTTKTKRKRQKWLKEALVLNTSTNIYHLPSAKIYHYYDEIKEKNQRILPFSAPKSPGNVNINKGQSGIILEVMCLSVLIDGVNDEKLSAATQTLSLAFSEMANNLHNQNMNEKNFRLHELMLQLVTLNTAIPIEGKWQVFNSKVKRPAALRKRQLWMATEIGFNDRVKFILNRRADYETRLVERAKKYSFT